MKISLKTWDKLVEEFRHENATYIERIGATHDPMEIDLILDGFTDAAVHLAIYVIEHRAVIREALALHSALSAADDFSCFMLGKDGDSWHASINSVSSRLSDHGYGQDAEALRAIEMALETWKERQK